MTVSIKPLICLHAVHRVELDMEEGDPTEVEEAEAADVAMDVDLGIRLYTTTLIIIQTSLISS